MPSTTRSPSARATGLTRGRIVDAAIELLDSQGERGLTFRALARNLETGHGAIQWHVANRGELLVAATVTVLTGALTSPTPGTPPHEAVHAVALGVFDAIDMHPWVATQLFAVPWQPAMVQLWEQLGRQVEHLGIPEHALFTAVSTLVSYIVGVGSQNAMNTHIVGVHEDRDALLHTVAGHWERLDQDDFPLVRRLGSQLRVHDDRKEFLAGIDIILTGLTGHH